MKYKADIKISDSEWLVLHVIWDKSPMRMREIVHGLSHTTWSRNTIQTMVARLLNKGIIGADTSDRNFLYYPAIEKEDVLSMYTKYFIERVYNNKAPDLIEEILKEDYLSYEEKEEIKKIIK